MKVRCSHGFFFFEETEVGDISRFSANFGFDIQPRDNYYTFAALLLAQDYSFKNQIYLNAGAVSLHTFEGSPWDVMRKNLLVYDFVLAKVRPISSTTIPLKIDSTSTYFYSDGLILPGSIDSLGRRVSDYTGYFEPDGMKFSYTEIFYDKTL